MSRPFHVIIAEDDPVVAITIAEVLETNGYRVTVGRNGFDALRTDENDPADLLITDIRMPHFDGATLVTRMKERRPELPILVTTGYSEQLPEEEPGQLAVMQKPFTDDAILRNVKSLLGVG